MVGRSTNPVIRKSLSGDAATPYLGIARTQLGILKNLMSFQELKQLSRTVELSDGTRIFVQSIFGQDTIRIDMPEIIEAGGEEVTEISAVNRVADYVGVAMPNPVPYRGVSIGIVNRGTPYAVSSTGTFDVPIPCVRTVNTFNSSGVIQGTYSGTTAQVYDGTTTTDTFINLFIDLAHANAFASGAAASGIGVSTVPQVQWVLLNGSYSWPSTQPSILSGSLVFTAVSPSYESLLAADIAAGTSGVWTYVMASDGTVLASVAQTQTLSGTFPVSYVLPTTRGSMGDPQTPYAYGYWGNVTSLEYYDNGNYTRIISAPGDGYNTQWGLTLPSWMPLLGTSEKNIWAFTEQSSSLPGTNGYGITLDHKVSVSIPDDCVYPPVPASPPTYPGTDGLGVDWRADWSAGITAFNTRRKAWYLKNSNEFMAALKGKFQPGAAGVTRAELQTGALPASWDYQIKSQYGNDYGSFTLADGSRAGRHTVMPIVMNVTYVDTVQSDTSVGLTQAGTMVTQRATTFQYLDAQGVNQTATVNGKLTQVVTQHTLNGSNIAISHQDAYLNWYSTSAPAGADALLAHQFLEDRTATSDAALWNGVVQTGYNSTSALGAPGNPLTYVGFSPAFPATSNTLVGTAAPLYLQYHNTVLPQYVANTAQSSTVMNNSAMHHVKQIELCLFGPAPGGQAIGIFTDPTDADGATQIAYYGEASFLFDWLTGKITPMGAAIRATPTIINMPAGYSYKNVSGTLYFNNGTSNYETAYNCAIGYVWDSPDQLWPDVAEYLRAKIAQLLAGTYDPVLYTIIKQALAL